MSRSRAANRKEAWIPSAVPFFLFGLFYYVISPAFVLEYLSADNLLLNEANRYIDSSDFDLSYFLDALVVLVSFLLGYAIARVTTTSRSSVLDYGSFQTRVPLLLGIMFGLMIVSFIALAKASGAGFFTGYTAYNVLVLGPFSTCAFMSAWFVNYFSNKRIGLLFLCFVVVCSVLLLGWGSRMFFILSAMALMLGLVSRNKRILRSPWFYGSIIAVVLLMVAVGILRTGGGEISGENLVAIVFAEPLFTSITGAIYLENQGGRPVFGIPYDLFAAVINFIPSPLYPGKIDLMYSFTYNEYVYAPFGARSLISSLYPNFGYFYPIFIAVVGFYFGFLQKKASHSVFFRATYFSALPILMLHFYREGLITLIKVMFFNGFLLPLVISLFLAFTIRRKAT